jgi:hypothetical protein
MALEHGAPDRHNCAMRLERPEVIARHRGVRPVFLLTLALALSIMVLVATRVRRHDDAAAGFAVPTVVAQSGGSVSSVEWSSPGLAHCNAVEVTTYLASHDLGPGVRGAAARAACLAVAGRIDAARQVILGRGLGAEDRDIVVNQVFLAGHPVADAGDDASAGPIMELVVEFQPDQFMARYHAGMAAAIAGDDARARQHLTRFLGLYPSADGYNLSARRALEALDRPRAQRAVKQGSEGSIVY